MHRSARQEAAGRRLRAALLAPPLVEVVWLNATLQLPFFRVFDLSLVSPKMTVLEHDYLERRAAAGCGSDAPPVAAVNDEGGEGGEPEADDLHAGAVALRRLARRAHSASAGGVGAGMRRRGHTPVI
ncbi:dihydroxyacetone kinase isoform A [Micractinium conductrix]|uniref:Dihydroxyacetone kinase isoform A n=1 Tax=Micractinium conductrix TaxID=554055 RepID=A0A2P6V961_9CHLO|nr:dihydroxyacetone kinase isoform A [Micractinium conductrix]|eukprot:PSC70637.1 dihydroxyacetone kinase isoform A [Micractinium conductrix]